MPARLRLCNARRASPRCQRPGHREHAGPVLITGGSNELCKPKRRAIKFEGARPAPRILGAIPLTNLSQKKRMVAILGLLAVTMPLLAPTATAQLPAHETLTPVENAACGPLDPIYAYACHAVFWGIYSSEHQVFCSAVAEFVPPHYIFGRRVVCEPPEEPRSPASELDVFQRGPMGDMVRGCGLPVCLP